MNPISLAYWGKAFSGHSKKAGKDVIREQRNWLHVVEPVAL
jgi:hypothetical protein